MLYITYFLKFLEQTHLGYLFEIRFPGPCPGDSDSLCPGEGLRIMYINKCSLFFPPPSHVILTIGIGWEFLDID